MSRLPDIELGRLQPEEIPLAAGVAARGMRDNPISIALVGEDPERRVRLLEPVYHWVLSSLRQPSLVARRSGIIVGIAALAPPDQCFAQQANARQKTMRIGGLRMGIAMPHVPRRLWGPLLSLGLRGMSRVSAWGEASFRHDPQKRHQHVELVVVEAALQGMGIGRLMMEELCRDIDRLPDVAYLETDKPENVRFYRHYCFEVTDETMVLDTKVWYMERRAGSGH